MPESEHTDERVPWQFVAVGDRMQSEGSRMAEWIRSLSGSPSVAPYEVMMAAVGFPSDEWTQLRSQPATDAPSGGAERSAQQSPSSDPRLAALFSEENDYGTMSNATARDLIAPLVEEKERAEQRRVDAECEAAEARTLLQASRNACSQSAAAHMETLARAEKAEADLEAARSNSVRLTNGWADANDELESVKAQLEASEDESAQRKFRIRDLEAQLAEAEERVEHAHLRASDAEGAWGQLRHEAEQEIKAAEARLDAFKKALTRLLDAVEQHSEEMDDDRLYATSRSILTDPTLSVAREKVDQGTPGADDRLIDKKDHSDSPSPDGSGPEHNPVRIGPTARDLLRTLRAKAATDYEVTVLGETLVWLIDAVSGAEPSAEHSSKEPKEPAKIGIEREKNASPSLVPERVQSAVDAVRSGDKCEWHEYLARCSTIVEHILEGGGIPPADEKYRGRCARCKGSGKLHSQMKDDEGCITVTDCRACEGTGTAPALPVLDPEADLDTERERCQCGHRRDEHYEEADLTCCILATCECRAFHPAPAPSVPDQEDEPQLTDFPNDARWKRAHDLWASRKRLKDDGPPTASNEHKPVGGES